jgi:zinc/manganese transport system permease protein
VSYYAKVPTGPAVIIVCGAFYVLSVLAGLRGGLLWRFVPRKHLEA